MVKNELSIRASQIENIARKMADNSIDRINVATAKDISRINALVRFKTDKQEAKLYEARNQYLKENIDALYLKSSLAADEVYLNNNRLIEKLEWSYVKIDRSNPDFEIIKKQIATHRHQSVITDNKWEKVAAKLKWYSYEQERDIKYKLEHSDLLLEAYGDNPHLEHITYKEFYENTNKEYDEVKNKASETMNALLPKIDEVINKAYEISYAKEKRIEIVALTEKIVSLKNELKETKILLVNEDVDMQILKQQAKEKLDVAEEINELNNEIINNSKKETELVSEIAKINEELTKAHKEYQEVISSPIEFNIDEEDEAKRSLLINIKDSFLLPANEVFGKIYEYIRKFFESICPFYYDFLANKEQEYIQQAKEYREANKASLDADLAKAYVDERTYLNYIYSKNAANVSEQLATLEKEHEDNLAKIEEEKKEGFENVKKGRENRKKEYLEQKEAAKIALKTADGTKASEIKEVLKIYKNDINAGDGKRNKAVVIEAKKKISAEQERYTKAKLLVTSPKALTHLYEYEVQVAKDTKLKSKELSKKYKELRKDLSLSKYRKNLNTTTRENSLGYLFLSVWAIGFVVFTLIPIAYLVLMSVSNVVYDNAGYSKVIQFSLQNGFTFPNFTGKANMYTLFLSNVDFLYTYMPKFFRSLAFYVPIVVFIGFVLALLLNSKIKGRTLFRIIYFLPVVIVSGPVLRMLNESNTSGTSSIRLTLDGSSVAKILESLSPKALQYANEVFQNFIIILWMTGVPIVLFISALQKINRQLYEAADIDGANSWQKLWTITFPLIKSVLLIVCLFTIMQVTTINVSFVNPINSWLENMMSAAQANLGVVALGAWCQTAVVLLFVLVSFLLFREKEFVSKDKNYEEIEEAKRKKAQRKARRAEILHTKEIRNFFAKLFSPITRMVDSIKQRKKDKEEGKI